jgi:D-glycero-D-manno-heptose 1,7-bisphosphate phosphatase
VKERDYLGHPDQLHVLPGVTAAMKSLREAGFKLVVVTNQSGVARGYFTPTMLTRIHRELKRRLAKSGAKWDALYFSPHGPDSKHPWRKPGIGMLAAAEKRFGLDLDSSYLVGDTTSDVQTALNAGCTPILVRTGHGGRDGKYPKAKPAKVCRDLAAAARWILSRPSQNPL